MSGSWTVAIHALGSTSFRPRSSLPWAGEGGRSLYSRLRVRSGPPRSCGIVSMSIGRTVTASGLRPASAPWRRYPSRRPNRPPAGSVAWAHRGRRGPGSWRPLRRERVAAQEIERPAPAFVGSDALEDVGEGGGVATRTHHQSTASVAAPAIERLLREHEQGDEGDHHRERRQGVEGEGDREQAEIDRHQEYQRDQEAEEEFLAVPVYSAGSGPMRRHHGGSTRFGRRHREARPRGSSTLEAKGRDMAASRLGRSMRLARLLRPDRYQPT